MGLLHRLDWSKEGGMAGELKKHRMPYSIRKRRKREGTFEKKEKKTKTKRK